VKSTNFEDEIANVILKYIYALEPLFWHKRRVPNPMYLSLEDGDKNIAAQELKSNITNY